MLLKYRLRRQCVLDVSTTYLERRPKFPQHQVMGHLVARAQKTQYVNIPKQTFEHSSSAVDTEDNQRRYNVVFVAEKPASLSRHTNNCDSVSHAFYAQLVSSTLHPARTSDSSTRPADYISDGTLLQHSHEIQSSKCTSQTSHEDLPSCRSLVNSPRENEVDIPLLNEHVTLEEQVDFERLVDEALWPLFDSCTVAMKEDDENVGR